MHKSGLGYAVKDNTASLTQEQKLAAAAKGYSIPFISEEAKYRQGRIDMLKAESQKSLGIK